MDLAAKNKHKDKLTHFPFTHGEQIEMQRKEIKAQTKVYLTEVHEAKERVKAEVKAAQLAASKVQGDKKEQIEKVVKPNDGS